MATKTLVPQLDFRSAENISPLKSPRGNSQFPHKSPLTSPRQSISYRWPSEQNLLANILDGKLICSEDIFYTPRLLRRTLSEPTFLPWDIQPEAPNTTIWKVEWRLRKKEEEALVSSQGSYSSLEDVELSEQNEILQNKKEKKKKDSKKKLKEKSNSSTEDSPVKKRNNSFISALKSPRELYHVVRGRRSSSPVIPSDVVRKLAKTQLEDSKEKNRRSLTMDHRQINHLFNSVPGGEEVQMEMGEFQWSLDYNPQLRTEAEETFKKYDVANEGFIPGNSPMQLTFSVQIGSRFTDTV